MTIIIRILSGIGKTTSRIALDPDCVVGIAVLTISTFVIICIASDARRWMRYRRFTRNTLRRANRIGKYRMHRYINSESTVSRRKKRRS